MDFESRVPGIFNQGARPRLRNNIARKLPGSTLRLRLGGCVEGNDVRGDREDSHGQEEVLGGYSVGCKGRYTF